jgi:hypothetical protein
VALLFLCFYEKVQINIVECGIAISENSLINLDWHHEIVTNIHYLIQMHQAHNLSNNKEHAKILVSMHIRDYRILLTVSLILHRDQLDRKLRVSNSIEQEHIKNYSQPILNLAYVPAQTDPVIFIAIHGTFGGPAYGYYKLHKKDRPSQVQHILSAFIPGCYEHQFKTGTYCCKDGWNSLNDREGIYHI